MNSIFAGLMLFMVGVYMAKGTKADELAKKQKEISVAEFFEKNRHLLGFDNKRKALLTTVKEAVDNSIDACEEANILPDITVHITDMGDDRFRIIVEDNGPGIVKKQIGKIFGSLLYGSKFHKLSQSRGQQGIGISASVMYANLTTGRAAKITAKVHKDKPAYTCKIRIDTKINKAVISDEKEISWTGKEHGVKIEIDLEGSYMKGKQSVDEYLKQTAIVNPHLNLIYQPPKGEQIIFPRASEEKVIMPKEIKPHPYGVELGMLMKLLHASDKRTLEAFMKDEFSRVTAPVAKEICQNARLPTNLKPQNMTRQQAEDLYKGIQETKIMAPPTDCLSPIGESLVEKGMKKEINAEFYCATSRRPAVYRGNPFVIECGIAYGGNIPAEGTVDVLRFANKVPLQFQPGACAITKSVNETAWKSYGLSQSGSNTPTGPAVVLVHMASVWVPFTSEAKEALAHYSEIIKEIKLAIQEAGRKLMRYTAKKRRVKDELKKRSYIEKYIPYVAKGLKELLGLTESQETGVTKKLQILLEKKRGEVKDMSFDASKNVDFDEEFAKIGKEELEEIQQEIDDEMNGVKSENGNNNGKKKNGKKRNGKK